MDGLHADTTPCLSCTFRKLGPNPLLTSHLQLLLELVLRPLAVDCPPRLAIEQMQSSLSQNEVEVSDRHSQCDAGPSRRIVTCSQLPRLRSFTPTGELPGRNMRRIA